MTETTRGVLYMCWGRQAIEQAANSMASLWEHEPDMPVFVLGDEGAGAHYRGVPRVTFSLVDWVDPFRGRGFFAGLVKPLMYRLSPFDWSLYVDAETAFRTSPMPYFELLEHWDFIVAESERRNLGNSVAGADETRWTVAWLGTPDLIYHNSGVLFWRRGPAVEQLFDLWSEEWLRFKNWDEQEALLRALLRSEAVCLTAPWSWNCRTESEASLVYHRFGTCAARKFHGRQRPAQGVDLTRVERKSERASRRVSESASQRVSERAIGGVAKGRLVRVEVVPGVFVTCHEADREVVLARYRMRSLCRAERRKVNAG